VLITISRSTGLPKLQQGRGRRQLIYVMILMLEYFGAALATVWLGFGYRSSPFNSSVGKRTSGDESYVCGLRTLSLNDSSEEHRCLKRGSSDGIAAKLSTNIPGFPRLMLWSLSRHSELPLSPISRHSVIVCHDVRRVMMSAKRV
jgi:hypothetical protein